MKKRALFLDRDGVINIDKVHTYKIEDFEFQDGIFNLCKKNEFKDFIIIVITNQSGISRKIYTEDDYHIVTKFMLEKFKEKNIDITKVYYCPYHPDFPIKKYKINRDEITFLSANTWDVSGGGNYGYKSIWVNRNKAIFDNLGYKPKNEIANLSQLLDII